MPAGRTTIVVQQPSLSLDYGGCATILVRDGDDTRRKSRICSDHIQQLLDVTSQFTSEDLHDFDKRYGSPHHFRSQSVKAARSRTGERQLLGLPQQRARVASMPNTGVEEEDSSAGLSAYRVLVLGGPGVGKSSLVGQFMTSECGAAAAGALGSWPHGQKGGHTEGKALATSYECKFIETSVGINHNVDELLVGLLTQIRLKQQHAERVRKRSSSRKNRSRARSPQSDAPAAPAPPPATVSAASTPRKRTRLSASVKVRGLLGRVWARDSKSKSCENLHASCSRQQVSVKKKRPRSLERAVAEWPSPHQSVPNEEMCQVRTYVQKVKYDKYKKCKIKPKKDLKPFRAKREAYYEKSTLQTDNFEELMNWFYEETAPEHNETFKKIAHIKEPSIKTKRDSENAPTIIALDDVLNVIGLETNDSSTLTPNHIDSPDSSKDIDDFLQMLALEEGKETKSPSLDATTKVIVNFTNDNNKIDTNTVALDTDNLNKKDTNDILNKEILLEKDFNLMDNLGFINLMNVMKRDVNQVNKTVDSTTVQTKNMSLNLEDKPVTVRNIDIGGNNITNAVKLKNIYAKNMTYSEKVLQNEVLNALLLLIKNKHKEIEQLTKIKESVITFMNNYNFNSTIQYKSKLESNQGKSSHLIFKSEENLNKYGNFRRHYSNNNADLVETYSKKLKMDINEVVRDILGIRKHQKSKVLSKELKLLLQAITYFLKKSSVTSTEKKSNNTSFIGKVKNFRRQFSPTNIDTNLNPVLKAVLIMLEVIDRDMPASNALDPLSPKAKKVFKRIDASATTDFFHSRRMSFGNDLERKALIYRINTDLSRVDNIIRHYKKENKVTNVKKRKQKQSLLKKIKTLWKTSKDDLINILRKRSKPHVVKEMERKKAEEEKTHSFLEVVQKWQDNLDIMPFRNKRSIREYTKLKNRMKNIIPHYLRGKLHPALSAKGIGVRKKPITYKMRPQSTDVLFTIKNKVNKPKKGIKKVLKILTSFSLEEQSEEEYQEARQLEIHGGVGDYVQATMKNTDLHN
ncbi:hypothetical protein MSG28_013947, partial [Choristoneura fumiferana]